MLNSPHLLAWRNKIGKPFIAASLFCLSLWILDQSFPFQLSDKGYATTVFAENGLPLRKFADSNGVWRIEVDATEISQNYLEALLTYEDRHFYSHPGVNPLSLARASKQWLSAGRIVSGGSTITMQVVRLMEPNTRTVSSKLRQILRALQLEWRYSKQEILNYYLNHAPFGGTIEGVEAASWHYFGHSASVLTDAQAALLAVLPQSPSYYRPDRHPQRAEKARNKVLSRLARFEVWQQNRVDEALFEPLVVEVEQWPTLAPLLSRKLAQSSQQSSIHTSIDYELQIGLESLLRDFALRIGQQVSAAALVVENQTGSIVGYKGSADFFDQERFAHVDMVSAMRSPGSTLKPFIYGLALQQGLIHSKSLLQDVPMKFAGYVPENFERRFSGPVAADDALQQSLNIPAVHLLHVVTPKSFYTQLVNAQTQLRLPANAKPNLSMALGGFATNLESLVSLYVAIANQGQVKTLSALQSHEPEPIHNLLNSETAWLSWRMLFDNPNKAYRTIRRAGFAAKTGTSYSHRDVWAIAVAQDYTIGVWLGRPDNVPVAGHYGSFSALPLVSRIIDLLPERQPKPLPKPDTVSEETVCWPTGKKFDGNCPVAKLGYVIDQHYPQTLLSPQHGEGDVYLSEVNLSVSADKGMRVPFGCDLASERKAIQIWPSSVESWLPSHWQREHLIPPTDPRCKTLDTFQQYQPLIIEGVQNGQAFKVNSLTSEQPKVTLKSNVLNDQYWFLNGKLIAKNTAIVTIDLDNFGTYQVVLMDQLGRTAEVEFGLKY